MKRRMKSEDENEDGEERKKAHDGGISTHYILLPLPPAKYNIIGIPDTSRS